jgi:biotin transport system substrate-specific component
MLRSLPQTRDYSLVYRLAGIAFFTAMTALAARVTIETGSPVPTTLQVMAVLLAGLVLGARDGALSQLAYVGLIAAGAQIDARLLGPAALFGPTGGFLIGFVPAAFIAGYLVEHGASRVWQRWLAGLAGIAVLYLFGVTHLRFYTGMSWEQAWLMGAAAFILIDLAKALVAAALAEGGRALIRRF